MTIQSHTFTYRYDGLDRIVNFFNSSSPSKQVNAILIALHGFTEEPEYLVQKVHPLLELGYAAAIPHGIEKSWNAGPCCGAAKKRQINDVGFITSLAQYFEDGNGWMQPNCKVYISGFSNGGFLTSRIALTTLANNGTWLHGAFMFAAYEYDLHLYQKALAAVKANQRDLRFPVMLAHGLADTTVNPSGCCDGSAIPCCCGITNGQTCFTLRQSFHFWSQINGCDSAKENDMVVTHNEFPFGYDADCYKPGRCFRNVTLCEMPRAGHAFSFDKVLAQIVPEWYACAAPVALEMINQQQDPSATTRPPTLETETNSSTFGSDPVMSPFGVAAILLLIVFVLLWGINMVWGNRSNDKIPVEGGSISSGTVVSNQNYVKKRNLSAKSKYELVSTQVVDKESKQIDEDGGLS